MGHWQQCARREGVSEQNIEKVIEMARAEDYDHLVGVLVMHCSTKPFAIADNELND